MSQELSREDHIIALERLRAMGKVSYKGNLRYKTGDNTQLFCPFHDETKPSFSINLNNSTWSCFSCKETGNLTTLCIRLVHTPLREFLGIPDDFDYKMSYIPKVSIPPSFPVLQIFGFVYPALKHRASYNYLMSRKITEKIISSMRMLYSPDCSINGSSMRNRVLIPIYNDKEEIISVEGRAIDPDNNPPKVLYPRNTYKPVYENHLLDKSKPLYLVEGLMDLARLREDPEFTNSTATFGTGLTEYQRNILNFYDKIILIPDNDIPGFKFAETLETYFKDKFSVLYIKDKNIKDVGDIPISVSEFRKSGGFSLSSNSSSFTVH